MLDDTNIAKAISSFLPKRIHYMSVYTQYRNLTCLSDDRILAKKSIIDHLSKYKKFFFLCIKLMNALYK